ncbi:MULTISPECIES: CarD family transcriptional regulator [Citricoccus]|uniref:CarD family transcriptional regulator n=1 Tax=Citricoccus TaxID=169133 RepID=UPI000255E0B0|nr:CarD family transcriptional regulator [Citricoccus sp. CH26A]
MRLVPGQFVVHPHHGPAVVLDRQVRQLKGKDVAYVDLEIQDKGLRISVPEAGIKDIGVRDVSSHTTVRKLMSLLAKPSEHVEQQWSRRIKAFQEKLSTGDLPRVAEVVRDLHRRQTEKELSMAERMLHREAVEVLAAEVAIVLDITPVEAEDVMAQAIDGTPLKDLGLDRGKTTRLAAQQAA